MTKNCWLFFFYTVLYKYRRDIVTQGKEDVKCQQKKNTQAKLARLNEKYSKLHEQMVEAYAKKETQKGHEINDKLENLLDVILLTEMVLENLK